MDDLRSEYQKTKTNTQIRNNKMLIYIKKNKYKILLLILMLSIILFPTFVGTVIGKWISSFVGSIIKHIVL